MPIGKKYSLERLIKACEYFVKKTGRKITLEYVLMKKVNDSGKDADGLARIARRLRAKVNLIPYSPVKGFDLQAPTRKGLDAFLERLETSKVRVTLRESKGTDIYAGCGQLAGRRVR